MMTDRKLKAAKAAFDTSIDCGITFFDTAEVYGSPVGKWFGFTCCLIHLIDNTACLKILLSLVLADVIGCYQLWNTTRKVSFENIRDLYLRVKMCFPFFVKVSSFFSVCD